MFNAVWISENTVINLPLNGKDFNCGVSLILLASLEEKVFSSSLAPNLHQIRVHSGTAAPFEFPVRQFTLDALFECDTVLDWSRVKEFTADCVT